MNGYEKRTQEKKANILKSAQELFAQNGVSNVSITDIATKANVSRVTLFKYFGDKNTLAREAMESWIEILVKEYVAIVTSNLPFHQKLLQLLNTRISGREKIGEQFINTTAWDDTQMRKIIYETSKNYAFPIILDFLEEGKTLGHIDNSLDSEAILVYLSAFGPIVQNPEYIKKGESFQVSLFNLFLGGLVKDWYYIQDK